MRVVGVFVCVCVRVVCISACAYILHYATAAARAILPAQQLNYMRAYFVCRFRIGVFYALFENCVSVYVANVHELRVLWVVDRFRFVPG